MLEIAGMSGEPRPAARSYAKGETSAIGLGGFSRYTIPSTILLLLRIGRMISGHIILSNRIQNALIILHFPCAISLSTSWILSCTMIQCDPITN